MTEIFATMGPSCSTEDVFLAMLREGLTGIRLNLSHASIPESHDKIAAYRSACEKAGCPAEIMIDLHGPEQRIGWLKKRLTLAPGDPVILKSRRTGETLPVVTASPCFLDALSVGDEILIHDGMVRLRVTEQLPSLYARKGEVPLCAEEEALPAEDTEDRPGETLRRFLCETVNGGTVASMQSIKIVGKEVYGSVVTDADRENLDLAAENGITCVMQPFVRSGEDVCAVREALRERGLQCRIFAKIESLTGVEHLSDILREADVIVIARGDLGNAVPLWDLPGVQKRIARACRAAGRPFMVVTQMLDSMTARPVPTRAEVSDIFNAVLDGAACVMVTGETSVGRYPVEVVRYLTRTVRSAEAYMKE
ncbi:MAG: pyruvate kinase [Clostridia bacterium]|nr:pyruvate kinase [Clostridia bacterium]